MNKMIFAAALAVGAGMSGSVLAEVADNTTPWSSGNISVTNTECKMLAEQVTLGASAKVHANYTCDEINNTIKVATCHEGGSRAGVQCSTWDDDNDPLTPEVLVPAAGCTLELAQTGAMSPTPSYSAFATSSAGGAMKTWSLDGRCENGTLTGLGFW